VSLGQKERARVRAEKAWVRGHSTQTTVYHFFSIDDNNYHSLNRAMRVPQGKWRIHPSQKGVSLGQKERARVRAEKAWVRGHSTQTTVYHFFSIDDNNYHLL
jgi:hypothetical protein